MSLKRSQRVNGFSDFDPGEGKTEVFRVEMAERGGWVAVVEETEVCCEVSVEAEVTLIADGNAA